MGRGVEMFFGEKFPHGEKKGSGKISVKVGLVRVSTTVECPVPSIPTPKFLSTC